jgi:hypothetical protein
MVYTTYQSSGIARGRPAIMASGVLVLRAIESTPPPDAAGSKKAGSDPGLGAMVYGPIRLFAV